MWETQMLWKISAFLGGTISGVEADVDVNYDSDSSLIAAANKSLDMSRSLGDKCADITQLDSSDEEGDDRQSKAQNHVGIL